MKRKTPALRNNERRCRVPSEREGRKIARRSMNRPRGEPKTSSPGCTISFLHRVQGTSEGTGCRLSPFHVSHRKVRADSGVKKKREEKIIIMPVSSTIEFSPFSPSSLSSPPPSPPPSYPFVQSFEKEFQYESSRRWLQQHNHLPIIAIITYLLFIYLVQKWMRDRPAFRLRGCLLLWNIALAVFSTIGAARSLQEFFHVQVSEGLHASICRDHQRDGVHAFWSFAFVASKLFELGDTVFIVLRKTDLLFLHWYHHVTVIIFGWFSGSFVYLFVLRACLFDFHSIYFNLQIQGIRTCPWDDGS